MSRLLLICFFLFASCSKDDIQHLTIAEQIQDIIVSRNISRVIAARSYGEFYSIGTEPQNGLIFKIENDFINFGTVSWNLNQLKSFVIEDFGNGKFTLGLIF